ncbi:Hypothetical protein RG540_CH13850 [Neorhizobium galegae bv. orientalis str. HAMBI 540]|uniref:Uncharacterized protein n=1 Tax=Neorhizobium galegae bv. orientalis str. HAMBI 540 TaxID=1028800 RepID=A0A068SR64_NEOGA|nr:Hypothetical protein RG540_CH13850 [Neorhizobium galegae bv. orientalis str. HAMBI 540]
MEQNEGSGGGPLVVAHPLAESIKLASKSISVDLVSSFLSGLIDLLLGFTNLIPALLTEPGFAVRLKETQNDIQDESEEGKGCGH